MARVKEEYYELCGEAYVCAYCGEACDQIDHTVPVSFVNQKPGVGSVFRFMKVHACAECNGFASDYIHQTFFERRICIAKGVAKKYKRELLCPGWTDEEISEMGTSMRSSILALRDIRKSVKRRLSKLRSSEMPEGIRDNLWEPINPLELGVWSGPSHGKTAQKIITDMQRDLRKIDKLYGMWGD